MSVGRRFRAEWEPQSAVLLAWPHERTDWADDLADIEPVYDRLVTEISRRQWALVLAPHEELTRRIRHRLREAGADMQRVCIRITPYDDTWTRDYGPLSVEEEGGIALMDFRFNGWGGKFSAQTDDRVPDRLYEAGLFASGAYHHLPWVLEGGALETDGEGTLLATAHSVITETRNPGASQADMEAMLRTWLGIRHIHWLQHGALSGDDTDGHVDTLARFAGPDTIVYVTAEAGDPDAPGLAVMAKELRALRKPDGTAYRLVPLPAAGYHRDEDGNRLPATYANFLIVNQTVLTPVYGVDADARALETLQGAFPGREVIPIDCRPLIRQNGSLHCATMQLPAGAFHCPADGTEESTP